jgi:hypothetical protein
VRAAASAWCIRSCPVAKYGESFKDSTVSKLQAGLSDRWPSGADRTGRRRRFFDNSAAVRVASSQKSDSGRAQARPLEFIEEFSLHEPERIKGSLLSPRIPICGPVAGQWFWTKARGDTGRGQDQCGQATKGVWGMSRRQEAMKGVEDCDKPGEAVKRALIPGFPNWRTLNP